MAKVIVNDSLIKRKVVLLDGSTAKIEGVTTRGYKVAGRSKQLIASNLVKVGAKLTEIEKPRASAIEDSGMGYASIIDADLYEEVHDKPMKSKAKGKGKAKTSKTKPKAKTSKTNSKAKTSKPKSKAKTSKPKEKRFVDSFAEEKILEPIMGLVSKAVSDYLHNNFEFDGELDVATRVVAPEILDDPSSPIIAIDCSVNQVLPEQEIEEAPVTMSIKAKKVVSDGLWERAVKAQAKVEAAFGAPLTVGMILESAKGTEFMFVGARKTEEGARLVFDATGPDEVVKQLTIAKAAELLSIQEEDDFGADETLEDEDDFDFAEDDLVDGDELDEDENSEMASTLTEEIFEQFEGDNEAVIEFLLENYTVAVMSTYIEENYEESRETNKIVNSEDALRIAELIADTEAPADVEEGSDAMDDGELADLEELDEAADDLDEGLDDDLDDLDGLDDEDLDSEDEDLDDLEDEDLDGDEADEDLDGEDEDLDGDEGELDVDAMVDALLDGNFVTPKELRKMEDADIVAAYEENFGSEEEELPSVDDMIEELLDTGAVKPREVRSLSDEEITARYKAQSESGDDLEDDGDMDFEEE